MMKLAFSTLGCPGWNWSEVLTAAADLGYDGIELRGLNREMYAPNMWIFEDGKWAKTLQSLLRSNLEIACLTSFCNLNKEPLTEAKDYVDLASRVGVPYVRVLCGKYAQPDLEDIDEGKVVAALQELADYIGNRPVTALVETSGYCADTANLVRILQKTDRPQIAALWDMHHPLRFIHETPETTVRNLGPQIRHVHLKDSVVQDGKVRYRMILDGDLPIESVVEELKRNHYDGYLSLEWLKRWEPDLEEPGVVFAHYVNHMRDLLGGR